MSIFENSIDNPNLQLLKQVRESSKKILYDSQNNYPYGIFLWETAIMRKFSLEGLLKAFGCFREIDFNIFIAKTLE